MNSPGSSRTGLDALSWRGLALFLVVLLTVGALIILLGWHMFDRTSNDLWSDVAKVGMQIAGVSVVGAVVTSAIKYVDLKREDLRRRDEARLRIFFRIFESYNEVKAVRRELRSLGASHATGALNAEQAQGIRARMTDLNKAQLALEAVHRELTQSSPFTDLEITTQVRQVEKYLGRLYEEWEQEGGLIWGGSEGLCLAKLTKLQKFFDPHDNSDFESNVAKRLYKVEEAVRRDIFGDSASISEMLAHAPADEDPASEDSA